MWSWYDVLTPFFFVKNDNDVFISSIKEANTSESLTFKMHDGEIKVTQDSSEKTDQCN